MVLETLVGTAVGYLVSSVRKSKGGKKAADELSTAVWDWVRPLFLVEEKEDQTIRDLQADPDDADNQQAVALRLKKHLKKNPAAQADLEKLLTRLQAEGEQPARVHIQQAHYGTGDNVGRDKIVGE